MVERKNRHLLEVARAMMFITHVTHSFWGEVVLTVGYLINRLPSKTLKFKTPLKTHCESYPSTPFFPSIEPKVFGCVVYVHNHSVSRTKLDPKALKCVFIGYSPSFTKGLQVLLSHQSAIL